MEWTDDAIILSARKHGERAVIVDALTRRHGRHAGLVRGGAGRRMRGVLEPGNEVDLRWRARLDGHLGNFSVELQRPRASQMMADPLRLAGLSAVCALTQTCLPEREPHTPVFEGFRALLDAMLTAELWPAVMVRFELGLLAELGFGLDLGVCAATGASEDLVFVSPRSGRAVSGAAGRPYARRLLALPAFLLSPEAGAGLQEITDGFALTGFFLGRHVMQPHGRKMPPARERFCERLKNFTPGGAAAAAQIAGR